MPRSSPCSYVVHVKGEFDMPVHADDSVSALVGSVRSTLTFKDLMFAEVFDVHDERERIWKQAVSDTRFSPEDLKILWDILHPDSLEVDSAK